jgi:ribosome-binding protein aMBF1 (putative translation factor)
MGKMIDRIASLFQKSLKCKLCGNKERKQKMWIVHMETADGPHEIKVCKTCAKTLNEMEGMKNVWLTKMMEN